MINKKLEKLQPLRHRVAVYVPGTNGVNTAADNSRYVKMAAATLSNLFGGATATPAIGYWMSDAAGLVEEKTAIYISHRMSSCRFCQQILVFDDGKIVQQGSHEELVEDTGGLYYEMWNAQAKYYQ